jgi:hypothetical protein
MPRIEFNSARFSARKKVFSASSARVYRVLVKRRHVSRAFEYIPRGSAIAVSRIFPLRVGAAIFAAF